MRASLRKLLVLDASVSGSAGGVLATAPISTQCRDFMSEMLRICHSVAMTQGVLDEWKRHESKFALQWRVAMNSRGKLKIVEPADIDAVEEALRNTECAVGARKAMEKDLLLIRAAIAADGIVVSVDGKARKHFCKLSLEADDLKPITWVNPTEEHLEVMLWLKAGAKGWKEQTLGF